MLRIHFTPEDMTRVKVAPGPDLLSEISNSVQTLQRTGEARVFGDWRRAGCGPGSRRAAGCSPLLPPHGYSPGFLTPSSGERTTLRAAVDTLLGTPRPRLRAVLPRLAGSTSRPGRAAALAEATRTRSRGGATHSTPIRRRRSCRTGGRSARTWWPTGHCGCGI